MNKKLLGIIAITIAFLFLLTPISAMSPIPTVKENTMVSEFLQVIKGPSVIPQSEFVITLEENEEVIWIADSVTRDDDIAYVTKESDDSPQPLPKGWYHMGYTITARSWWGWPLFRTKAAGLFHFTLWQCTDMIDLSTCFSFCWRYTKENFESHIDAYGWQNSFIMVSADGYFKDNLIHRYPHISILVEHVYGGSGNTVTAYLDWGD